MPSLRNTLSRPTRRLLTPMEAAAYCGAPSLAKWTAACHVRPLAIYSGRGGIRYDVADLDKWIDSLKDPRPTAEEWLAKLGSASNVEKRR